MPDGNWRPVLRGLYYVCADGCVTDSAGEELEARYDDDGWQVVTLTVNGTDRTGRVRDLVQLAFAPESQRARGLNHLGVPAGDYAPASPRWLAGSDLADDDRTDITAPTVTGLTRATTTDLTVGHPLRGRAPWPTR